MNTWVVGNQPIGHYILDRRATGNALKSDPAKLGEKTFFMKARIMAGQANLDANALQLQDFKWLTREELAAKVGQWYFSRVKNMLPSR